MIGRRGFLLGLGSALAAPAIVKITSIMPVKAPLIPAIDYAWDTMDMTGLVTMKGNQLLSLEMITRESLRLWTQSNTFNNMINTLWDEGLQMPHSGRLRIGV